MFRFQSVANDQYLSVATGEVLGGSGVQFSDSPDESRDVVWAMYVLFGVHNEDISLYTRFTASLKPAYYGELAAHLLR